MYGGSIRNRNVLCLFKHTFGHFFLRSVVRFENILFCKGYHSFNLKKIMYWAMVKICDINRNGIILYLF